MNEYLKNEVLIVRYLEGGMSEAEAGEFEKQLEQDNLLRFEFENKLAAVSALRYAGICDKVRLVQKDFTARYHKARNRKASMNQAIRFGVGVAAIVFLIWIIVVANSFYSLDPDQIYKESFVTYELTELPGQPLSRDSTELNYSAGDYQKVVKEYRKVVLLSDKEFLLAGVSYLEMNDAFSAIPPLRKVAFKENVYKESAEYYLALAYLKNRDYDLAYDLMQKIHNNPHHLYNNKFTGQIISEVQMLKWR